uniref:Zinc metalloproteinase-disintegrin-like mikarin (Fragments) n=1 Tax=Micropechis ikaheca TaxID=66188 RepID=VM3_MICIK|nr:RecName: Full=Zinc metalloproteinase-disintegrin-like mikarin; AltName: Full=Snake venom metalloproteinase; Short=SVMP [Micropechis ikaheca]
TNTPEQDRYLQVKKYLEYVVVDNNMYRNYGNAGPCVMSAEISFEPLQEFSSCDIQEPLSQDIVQPAVCGNYYVEVGGECDCGSPKPCRSACCNAATCKLQREHQCDSGECCEKKDDCDLPEICTGRSAKCSCVISQGDLGYGMVEPGTKCTDGMVCSNEQCVDVQTAAK